MHFGFQFLSQQLGIELVVTRIAVDSSRNTIKNNIICYKSLCPKIQLKRHNIRSSNVLPQLKVFVALDHELLIDEQDRPTEQGN